MDRFLVWARMVMIARIEPLSLSWASAVWTGLGKQIVKGFPNQQICDPGEVGSGGRPC
jgi:hypothetical protein